MENISIDSYVDLSLYSAFKQLDLIIYKFWQNL